jgi:IclR helix-turn-helix domain
MSVDNVRDTLGSVGEALEHFRQSLEAGGFEDGADTYARMSDIVVGQRLWARSEEVVELEEEFERVATIATRIHALLLPYVDTMARLGSLASLDSVEGIDPGSAEGRVLAALARGGRALSVTAIKTAVGEPMSRVRAAMEELEERGLVTRMVRGGRPFYTARG